MTLSRSKNLPWQNKKRSCFLDVPRVIILGQVSSMIENFQEITMRPPLNKKRLEEFMEAVGKGFQGKYARIYFAGGASLVYEGLKDITIDIDINLKETPPQEQGALLRLLNELKYKLEINIEEASPEEFIPLPSGAMDRGIFIQRRGKVDFFHFDLYSIGLSKIGRGSEKDYEDILNLLEHKKIFWKKLEEYSQEILPKLAEYSLKADPRRFVSNFDHLKKLWFKKR